MQQNVMNGEVNKILISLVRLKMCQTKEKDC